MPGHGVVRSDYRFDEARPEYKHVWDIEWLSETNGVKIRYSVTVLSAGEPARPDPRNRPHGHCFGTHEHAPERAT